MLAKEKLTKNKKSKDPKYFSGFIIQGQFLLIISSFGFCSFIYFSLKKRKVKKKKTEQIDHVFVILFHLVFLLSSVDSETNKESKRN